MSILENVRLPDNAASAAVKRYLQAQERKDFADATDFMAADVHFNGLVLNKTGVEAIAAEMNQFLPAIETLRVEAAAQVEDGERSRFLVLYWFKLIPQAAEQPLCDHIVVAGGKITRVDNVFDASKLPPMPQ